MLKFRRGGLATGIAVIATATAAVAVAVPASMAGAATHSPRNEFRQTNLISDLTTQHAKIVDPNLKNPWGLAFLPTSPLWVADNNSGKATVYSVTPGGAATQNLGLVVTVPGGAPTGQVANAGSGFVVKTKAGTGPALFIFSSESGKITAWSPAADPIAGGKSTATIEAHSGTAIYKGLAVAGTKAGAFLYATNFHDGTVDVWDSNFKAAHLPGHFKDSHLPHGYAPFGIRELNGYLYVTYALQNGAKEDDVKGPGHGFIDIYTNTGFLVRRLASHGALDSPWGLAIAPSGFGPFAGKLIVGNFGNGTMNVFGPASGHFLGTLRNEKGKPIVIPGLWGLTFGTATTGGTKTLLFSAGINGEADGLVGSINADS
jgi:uncharacterized protein (TIGR03118 family)